MDFFLLAMFLSSTLAQEGMFDIMRKEERQWGYEVENGPNTWPQRFPESCAGLEQSPININTDQTVFNPNLKPYEISDRFAPRKEYAIINNEEVTVETDVLGQFYLLNGGLSDMYKVEQMHFHWGSCNSIGSEHTLNGRQAPIELHIVSWLSKKYQTFEEAANNGGVVVLGVLFRLSHVDNPVFEPIIQALPRIADPDLETSINIPAIAIQLLFPERPHMYYHYNGSFTTPTCTEGVMWSVFHEKQTLSYRQLGAFRKVLKRGPWNIRNIRKKMGKRRNKFYSGSRFDSKSPLVNNFRPVQPLNGRTVYRSF